MARDDIDKNLFFIQDVTNKHFFTGKIYYKKKEAVAIELTRQRKDAKPFKSMKEAEIELSRIKELGFDRNIVDTGRID